MNLRSCCNGIDAGKGNTAALGREADRRGGGLVKALSKALLDHGDRTKQNENHF